MSSGPGPGVAEGIASSTELLAIESVDVVYRSRGVAVRAVHDASLTVARGQVVGLVGESGCGKSTLARAAVGMLPVESGSVRFAGQTVNPISRRARPVNQRRLQMIFQDPYSSLNPRRRIGSQIKDALRLAAHYTGDYGQRVAELLERVQLPPDTADKYPHEFSGGQRQRIAIARALAADPAMIVADEAISALDASAQAAISNLLVGLAREFDVGLLFISHDLSVVRQVADALSVMYLGTVVESGPTQLLWDSPRHPYTSALIAAVPEANGEHKLPQDLPGDVPNPANPPSGCLFHPRCPARFEPCDSIVPHPVARPGGVTIACHLFPVSE
ncbi:MAG: ABC transporter ATP-binding protein [Actinomycetota bacterium]|nr:ABC transporter ATP-binding protein [Actinomycetota bacterium]